MNDATINPTALNNIAAFVIATLPDSLSRRIALLSDLVAIIPESHPLRVEVSTMLLFLRSHEDKQLVIPHLFAQQLTTDQP